MSDNPFVKPITGIELVTPKRNKDGGGGVVILDRIEPGVVPQYCTHGKTTCYSCEEWCWLGSETYKVVSTGEAAPMCLVCAYRIMPDTRQAGAKKIRRLKDHR